MTKRLDRALHDCRRAEGYGGTTARRLTVP
jgi:hypothetical protein